MWGLGTTGGSAGAGFAPPYPPPLDPVGMTFFTTKELNRFFLNQTLPIEGGYPSAYRVSGTYCHP
jgi:hypothetical protein